MLGRMGLKGGEEGYLCKEDTVERDCYSDSCYSVRLYLAKHQ